MIKRTRVRQLAIAVAVTASALGAMPVVAAGSWSPVAQLNLGRTAFAAVTLADGSVLVAGGSPSATVGNTAERYDPATDTWTNTGNLSVGRANHALVSFSGGGAMAIGGNGASGFLHAVERFDAATSSWAPAAPLTTARANHTATPLADGRILVVGGTTAKGGATNEVEIYSPTTDTWTRAASIKNPRYNHTATLLADGRVFVAGGFTPGSFHTPTKKAEVYDPVADKWTTVGSMLEPRAVHAAVLLADGRVLVAGGVTSPPNVLTVTGGTEIWDPATGAWATTGALGMPRRAVEAERLADDTVLVAGGFGPDALTASSERYDPAAGTWSSTASLTTARAPVLVRLANGRVLAIASIGGLRTTAVEAYTP